MLLLTCVKDLLLFVYGFMSRIFHSFVDVIIRVKGLIFDQYSAFIAIEQGWFLSVPYIL